MVRRSTPVLWCVIQPWICQAASITTLPKPDDSVVLPRQVNGDVSSSTFLRRGYHTCEHCRHCLFPQYTMTIGLIEPKPRFWTGECTLTAARFRITAVPTSTFNTVRLLTNKSSSLQHHSNSTLANSLLSIDLTEDWTSDSVRFDSTSKPSGAANLDGGGIWVDETEGVLYTGFAGTKSNFGDNANQPQGLWSFKPDGKGGGTWQNLNSTADKTFTEKPRPFKGKVASGNGVGYFLGGTQAFFSPTSKTSL